MALATVVDHHNNHHLHLESLPLIDLRLLSQSELYSLSLTSYSSSSHPNRRFDDDVLIPKIDRSVFNESAGSRKQTYSRLRLAPRNSQFASNSKSTLPRQTPLPSQPPLDRESLHIIALLKQLFPSDAHSENDLVSVPVRLDQYDAAAPEPSAGNVPVGLVSVADADVAQRKRKRGRPRKDSSVVIAPSVKEEVATSSTALTGVVGEGKDVNTHFLIQKRDGENTPTGIVGQSSEGKRKRGRPRKDENRVAPVGVRERKGWVLKAKVEEEAAEMVMVNRNGDFVDLDALGNAGDNSFGEELRKRTAGLEMEGQLLGFLGAFDGEWSSARKKRRIVQATELSDLLPRGWKIMLSLKRNGGHVCLSCRRYISPNGQQFVSCKEVSSYLLSYFGLGSQSKPGYTDGNIQVYKNMVSGDGMQQNTNPTFKDDNNADELVSCSLMPNISVKNYVQSIEASGVMSMPEKFDPAKSGVLQTSLKIQESVQIDREETSDAIANYDLGSGFPRGESISLSCEERAMKADKSGKAQGSSEQGSACNLTNDKLVKVEEATDVGEGMGKEHRTDDIDNKQLTRRGENMKIDDVDDCRNDRSISGISESHIGSEDIYTDVKQQSTSDACSLIPSIMMESLQERGSEGGLYSTSTDEKSCAVSNSFNNDSFHTFYEPKFNDIDISESNDKTISFGRDHAMPDVDAMTISERIRSTGSCSNVSPLDVQSCTAVNNAKNPCTEEELWRGKSFESNIFTPFVDKQSSYIDNNLLKGSIHAVEGPKVDNAKNCKNSQLSVNFGSRDTGTDADTLSCIEGERSSKGYSLASYAKEHTSVLKNNLVCNNIMEKLKQDRGSSETDLVCPSVYGHSYDLVNNVNNTSSRSMEASKEEVKRSWNNEVLLDFRSSDARLDVNAMRSSVHERSSGRSSLIHSENNQTFSTGNNATGVFSSLLEDKLIRGPVNGLVHPSGSEQIPGFENNLNRVYGSRMWEQPESEDEIKSRNKEPMTGFLNHSQPSGDVMAELMWRMDEQNVQQSGLADGSSALMQSAGSHPNFDGMPGKGAKGDLSVNEKFDNISGLEGLKSGRIDQLEYDFLTAQASSHSMESKVMSYDGRMDQGLNSSAWLEREALPSMPNIASRREINICVWCRNEFYHEVYGAGTHTGSVGFMCATCYGKFGQVNFHV